MEKEKEEKEKLGKLFMKETIESKRGWWKSFGVHFLITKVTFNFLKII